MFYNSALSNTLATSFMWLLSTWNVATATEKLYFKLNLILVNLNLNSYIWPVATIMLAQI